MKAVLLLAAAAIGLLLATLVLTAQRGGIPANGPPDHVSLSPSTGDPARVAALEAQIRELMQRMEELDAELDRIADRGRRELVSGPAGVAPAGATRQVDQGGRWFLERYVDSFRGSGTGAEYYRLGVQAHLPDLVEDVSAIVSESTAKAILRERLVAMLGDARLEGRKDVIDLLASRLSEPRHEPIPIAAIASLQILVDKRQVVQLERRVWKIRFARPRVQCLRLIVELAGADANDSILRLFRTAPDEAARVLLVELIQTRGLTAALEAFELASRTERNVRLNAAKRVGGFRSDEFITFVEGWILRETDKEILALLGAAKHALKQVPNYHAAQMIGAPDVENPSRDHPNAWASQAQDAGSEWVELTYAQPFRASGLRIFEVLSAGAVAKVTAYDALGRAHVVWEGVDPTKKPGVFNMSFETTSFAVSRVRIDLDTSRATGWNEIDAVEMVGPGRRSWATGARASSNYGSGSGGAVFGASGQGFQVIDSGFRFERNF